VWKLVRKIPFSGPLILSDGNARISIRQKDASTIFVEVE